MLVENSTHENISQQDGRDLDGTTNAQDSMLGRSLVSTVQVVFMQCSEELFKVCIKLKTTENKHLILINNLQL